MGKITVAIVKTHPKGQIIIPKDIRDALGIEPDAFQAGGSVERLTLNL